MYTIRYNIQDDFGSIGFIQSPERIFSNSQKICNFLHPNLHKVTIQALSEIKISEKIKIEEIIHFEHEFYMNNM